MLSFVELRSKINHDEVAGMTFSPLKKAKITLTRRDEAVLSRKKMGKEIAMTEDNEHRSTVCRMLFLALVSSLFVIDAYNV